MSEEFNIDFNIEDEDLRRSLELVHELETVIHRITEDGETRFAFADSLNQALLENLELLRQVQTSQRSRTEEASSAIEAERQGQERLNDSIEETDQRQQELVNNLNQNLDEIQRRIQEISSSSRNIFSNEIIRQIVEATRYTETLAEEAQGIQLEGLDQGLREDPEVANRRENFNEYIQTLEELSNSLGNITENLTREIANIDFENFIEGFEDSYQEFISEFVNRLLGAAGELETNVADLIEDVQAESTVNYSDLQQSLESLAESQVNLTDSQEALLGVLQARSRVIEQLENRLVELRQGLAEVPEVDIDNISNEIQTVQDLLEGIERSFQNIPVTFDAEEVDVQDVINQQISSIKENINDLTRQIENGLGELENLDPLFLNEWQEEIANLQNELNNLEADISELRFNPQLQDIDVENLERVENTINNLEQRISELNEITLSVSIDENEVENQIHQINEQLENLQNVDLEADLEVRRNIRTDVDIDAIQETIQDFLENLDSLQEIDISPILQEMRNSSDLLRQLIDLSAEINFREIIDIISEEVESSISSLLESQNSINEQLARINENLEEVPTNIVDSASMMISILESISNSIEEIQNLVRNVEFPESVNVREFQEDNLREVQTIINNLVRPVEVGRNVFRDQRQNERLIEQVTERADRNLEVDELEASNLEIPRLGEEDEENEAIRNLSSILQDFEVPELMGEEAVRNLETINNDIQNETNINIAVNVNGDVTNREVFERMANDLASRLKEAIRTSYQTRRSNL